MGAFSTATDRSLQPKPARSTKINRVEFARGLAAGLVPAEALRLAGSQANPVARNAIACRIRRQPRVQRLVAQFSRRVERAVEDAMALGWREARARFVRILTSEEPTTVDTFLLAFDKAAKMHGAYLDNVQVTTNHVLTFRQLAPGDPIEALRSRGIQVPIIDVAPGVPPVPALSPPGEPVARQEPPGRGNE
jgi:hypothetical protein